VVEAQRRMIESRNAVVTSLPVTCPVKKTECNKCKVRWEKIENRFLFFQDRILEIENFRCQGVNAKHNSGHTAAFKSDLVIVQQRTTPMKSFTPLTLSGKLLRKNGRR